MRPTLPGTNNPAPRFVRNYDGPVLGYRFSGTAGNNVFAIVAEGGNADLINLSTTDTSFDGFGQNLLKLWTTTDPGSDIQVSGPDPNNVVAESNPLFGFRSITGATGIVDVSGIPAGSLHIYYGDYSAKPSVSVVMRDTDAIEPDITIADAHLNNDTANSAEIYLAEIDFVTNGDYEEVEIVWTAGNGNGRGFGVVVTEAAAPDAVLPTLAPADIVDDVGGGPISSVTPISYSVTYSELMDPATIDASDFSVTGTATGAVDSVVHYGNTSFVTVVPTPGTSGTLQLQVNAAAVITDLAGNELDTTSAIVDDSTVLVEDVVAPTVTSIESPSVSGTIYGLPTLTYTVTFSEFVQALDATNFTNGGTAAAAIGTVTQISGAAPEASVYTVEVIPSGSGTVQLEIIGAITDPSSNALVVPVTDAKVFTIDTGAEPARETVTLDASTTSNSTSGTHTLTFDASASDKLVVIVTGENGNPGSLAGKVNSIKYDGVDLVQAVGRLPIGSSPSGPVDQLYNDIWYLDDPAGATASVDPDDPDGATTGNIVASVNSRGVITAIRLSGTADGVGATAISAQEVKTVDVLAATSGGMVFASLGMGGDGNTANTESVNTDPLGAELSAVKQGSSWDGHVTAQTTVVAPGYVTTTFTGGNTVGTHVVAAEFLGALSATDPFADWAVLDGATGVTFEGDANSDGVQDGLAFLLGAANPNVDANAAGLLPVVTETGGGLQLDFNCLPVADRGTAKLYVQHSNDLGTWTPDPGVEVPDGPGGGPTSNVTFSVTDGSPLNSVTATIDSGAAAGGKLFGRLKATETAP
jgi:hypothetical protein